MAKGSAWDLSLAFLGFLYYSGTFLAMSLLKGTALFKPFNAALSVAATGSLLFSFYLFYVLKFILKDFCIVCFTMYLCNSGIAWGSLKSQLGGLKRKQPSSSSSPQQEQAKKAN